MSHLFSTAICPPQSVVAQVREMKNLLASRAGWFGSKSADAHVTVNLFEADAVTLTKWEAFIEEFCSEQTAFDVMFVSTGRFANGAYFLAPDSKSKDDMNRLLSCFNNTSPFAELTKSTLAHMSIGRKLTQEQTRIADELWSTATFNISFRVDALFLRKFDPIRKQYSIYKRFGFAGID